MPDSVGRADDERGALKMLVAATLAAAAYSGAGTIGCGEVTPSRWVLVYSGGPKRPAYTVDDLRRLLSVVDTTGRSVGPLCDGVILTEYQAVSGRYYMPWTNGTPATGADWTQYLDSIFAAGGPLSRLDSAAARLGPIRVAIMVPYPHPRVDTLRFVGREYSMARDADRAASVETYLREVDRRLHGLTLPNLSVSAFYWLNEGVLDSDTAVVSRVAKAVHEMGMRFLWIPSWGARNATNWSSLGFDQAWQQPNYFFHSEITPARIDSALDRARSAEMGLEIEFDRRLFSDPKFADRLQPYLTALEKAPDLRRKPIALYEGAGALIQLSRSAEAAHRALYDRLVAVLRSEASQ